MSRIDEKKQRLIEYLQARVREESDFPAMSRTVDLVKNQTDEGVEISITELTNAILDDYGLTNKLLKLVNSVFYINYQLEGKISTVSRAVFVLGYNQVRNAAISLMFFENLANKKLAVELKESILMSFMSAVIARQTAAKIDMPDTEEVFICSLFHNLGRLLTAFYMPEYNLRVAEKMEQPDVSEKEACRDVMGLSYEELGIAIAREWNFPERMIKSMSVLPRTLVPKPKTKDDALKTLANFSDELARVYNDPNALKSLLRRYGDCFNLDEKSVMEIMESSMTEIRKFAKVIGIEMHQSPIMKQISGIAPDTQMDDLSEGEMLTPMDADILELEDSQVLQLLDGGKEKKHGEDAESILSNGIQEVANSLLENASINDILRTILEIMYRGLKFNRVFICIKHTREPVMVGRFGFGAGSDKITHQFRFPVGRFPDVFNLALSNGADIIINDVNDPRIKSRIPGWYRSLVSAGTFLLFPLVINGIPIGIIYADRESAGDINIPAHQLSLLKTLRNQAILAIQKRTM
jgi:HD-like signal output (HDOD) protein